jgi:hypothetical protein
VKKLFGLICVGLLVFSAGCEIHHHDDGFAGPVCYEEPPFYEYADYCETYPEGMCCGWYVYDTNSRSCYEEWCVWDVDCGWEYEGDFCPMVL